MQYKINITGYENIQVYGTPKKDRKSIKVGHELWLIAKHIWGDVENSRIVRYENVVPFPESSIIIRFISKDYISNHRRAKLLIAVWKFAYKNVPVIEPFFPKRNDSKKINEDYDSIVTDAATLFKNYNEKKVKESKSSLRMLDKALNQKPNDKILSSSKPIERDKAEKLINKMLKEDVSIINSINDILTNTLYVDERGDFKSIGGKENANKAIRRIIKRQFLKRYKVAK